MKVTRTLAAWALALVVSAAQAVPVFIDPLTFSGPTLWTIKTVDDGSTVVIDPTGQSVDLGISYATAYTAWEMKLESGVTSLFVAALGSSGFDPFTKVGQASYTGAGLSSILFEKSGFSVTGALLNGDTSVDSPLGLDAAGEHSIFGLFDNRYPGATFGFYTSGPGTARLAFEGITVVTTPPPIDDGHMPEPASLALVGLAMFAASFASRRFTA